MVEFSEFLVEADELSQGSFTYWHEPCGAQVLVTRRAHLDTLAQVASNHACEKPAHPPECWCKGSGKRPELGPGVPCNLPHT